MLELILLSMSRIREKKLWESYDKLFIIKGLEAYIYLH